MQLGERFFDDDGRIIHQRVQAVDPYIERARLARDAPAQPMSDSWHVASVPMWLVNEWLKEAGVSWDDTVAAKDVVRRKLMSGEAAAFRVREGRF